MYILIIRNKIMLWKIDDDLATDIKVNTSM